jgi:UDP-glucose 4-epimerase
MAKAEDQRLYFRIPADNRDLNYNKYIVEGQTKVSEIEDYTSHNTQRLNIEEIKGLLLKLSYIQEELQLS